MGFVGECPSLPGTEFGRVMAGLETHYSARDIQARILAASRSARLDPEQPLSPDYCAGASLRRISRCRGRPTRPTAFWFRPTKCRPCWANADSVSVFVDDLGQKATNARRSLEEGQVRLVRGVFRR